MTITNPLSMSIDESRSEVEVLFSTAAPAWLLWPSYLSVVQVEVIRYG